MVHGSVGFEDWKGDRDCRSRDDGLPPGVLTTPPSVFQRFHGCRTNKMCVLSYMML